MAVLSCQAGHSSPRQDPSVPPTNAWEKPARKGWIDNSTKSFGLTSPFTPPQPLRGHAQGAVELLSPFPAHTGRRASVQRGGCRFGSIPWIRPVISPGEQAKDDSTAKERARSITLENDPPTYGVPTARTPASFSGLATRRTVRTILSETSRTSAETGSSLVVSTTPGSPLTWAKCTRNSPDGSDGLQETGRPLLGRDGEQEPGYLHLLDATTGITTGHGRHALRSSLAVMRMVDPTRA